MGSPFFQAGRRIGRIVGSISGGCFGFRASFCLLFAMLLSSGGVICANLYFVLRELAILGKWGCG